MSTEFEKNYCDIANTELWRIFCNKLDEENLSDDFKTAVGDVCEFGIIKSKDIERFFENFTLHDITHIRNVCVWMTRLLGDRKNKISAREAAMLLMAACCHDIGMSVSEEQKKSIEKIVGTSGEKQREYVRKHHHERVREHLTPDKWQEFNKNNVLLYNQIELNELLELCKSHGEALEKIKVPKYSSYDFKLCVVLLCLADILDLDISRAPKDLFKHMGLDSPEDQEKEFSQSEWIKNCSGYFCIRDNNIIFNANYYEPKVEHKLKEYIKWVEYELDTCTDYIADTTAKLRDFKLPYRVIQNVNRYGYRGDDIKITMNQENIIKLLTGENLYSDPCVFVRELLQNSIDAILLRGTVDPNFNAKEDGKITITTWYDESGQGWFRIEDNGTGMDEKIIMNYFLTAGNSYYITDDFKNELRAYGRKRTYKPISRFGIGILSCFMSDENNVLEVSTKRYSYDPTKQNAGLRLSVTGLKGYYALANEYEDTRADWQVMPKQNHETEMCYRNEPGTTICVGMNLFSLGNYRNIKEVVDKYVQFPEMKVEYHGPEGNKEYYTKEDFTKAVDALKKEHGDTKQIVCTYPIPEKEFEKLQKQLPELEFESTPELVFTYYPLDKFTSGNNLCGMIFIVSVNTNCKRGVFEFRNIPYVLDVDAIAYFYDKDKLEIRISVKLPSNLKEKISSYSEENKKISEAYKRFNRGYEMEISYDTICDLLSESEKKIFELTVNKKEVIVYNGVFASDSYMNFKIDYMRDITLLSGDYVPDVNVASNIITNLPIECAFELEYVQITINESLRYSRISTIKYLYCSEKELYELIKKHPEWEQNILIETIDDEYKTITEIYNDFDKGEIFNLIFVKNALYYNIALTYLKRLYTLCVNEGGLRLTDKKDNAIDTSDFPVQLFFEFPEDSKVFGKVNSFRINYYSPKHRFSEWLIKNREELQKELPKLYSKILEIMIMSNSKNEVITQLNGRLKQLINYKNNMFNVTDELFLTDSDIIGL